MALGWSSDFSFRYFRMILQAIKYNFELHLLSEAPRILSTIGQPKVILRHDIDVSLKKALRMAEIEEVFGICATYMVMINSPLYSVHDVQDITGEIIDMGHEVGLHFDLDNNERNSNLEISSVEQKIHSSCKQLEEIIGRPVRSISFHRPIPRFMRGPLIVSGGLVNAYSRELMAYYLSDSKGRWREGEPLPKLLNPDRALLQLLIHPIWWGDEHMLPEERLQAFFEEATRGHSCDYIEAFDDALASTIPAVRRRGFHNEVKGGK